MGLAYRITGEAQYAGRAKEVLVGYSRRYPTEYKEHKGVNSSDTSKVMAQRLSEAMWLLPLLQSYDHVADADCLKYMIENGIGEDCMWGEG